MPVRWGCVPFIMLMVGGKGAIRRITTSNNLKNGLAFWGYSDINDKYGSPRPGFWFALRDYMKALIIQPEKQFHFTPPTKFRSNFIPLPRPKE